MAGVLPSSSATSRITLAMARRAAVFDRAGPRRASPTAAMTVACQVRRSFAVMSIPLAVRR
jgi:hypothetical protein